MGLLHVCSVDRCWGWKTLLRITLLILLITTFDSTLTMKGISVEGLNVVGLKPRPRPTQREGRAVIVVETVHARRSVGLDP